MKLQNTTNVARSPGGKAGSPRKGAAAHRSHGRWYGDGCAMAFGMELIAERWSLPIIREMMLGPRRFSELRGALPVLSAKTLTERLEGLEASGIVERALLPPPVSAQAYRLTAWGHELEPVMQALGRWAVRSPMYDPALPLTPVALMLSLRTMLDPARIGDLELWIAFDVGEQRFAGRLRAGDLSIHPAGDGMPAPDLRFSAPHATDFLPVFCDKAPLDQPRGALRIEGDADLAARFVGIFVMPPKCTG